MGAGYEKRAVKAGWLAVAGYTVICVFITLASWIFAEDLVRIFNDEPEMVKAGAEFLRWLSVTFFFIGLAIILGRALNGAGDTVRPMLMAGISLLLVGVTLSYVLADLLNDVSGIWAGIAISNVLHGVLMAIVYKFGNWKSTARRHAGAIREARLVPSGE